MRRFLVWLTDILIFAGMKEVRFTKMHGIGNDYVYFTEEPCPPEELGNLSRRLSNRHYGIGGDGIILVLGSSVADFRMRIFNADGSEARMCGNGSRCVGKLVYDSGLTSKTDLTLETLSGIKHLKLHIGSDGKVESVTVDMGTGITSDSLELATSAGPVEVTPVDMGNPHGVVFIDVSPEIYDVHGLGRELEIDKAWPDRANIEFAQVLDRTHIRMRVWERGSGETMACGTGACATAVAAVSRGLTDRQVTVSLPGGDLLIEVDESGKAMMSGPATTVFNGSIKI